MLEEEQRTPRAKSFLRELVETIAFTLLIYLLVRNFLFENYRVLGHSMDPTLEDAQLVMVNKLGYRLHAPERGDIVVFYDPRTDAPGIIERTINQLKEIFTLGRLQSDRPKLIKRIVGLPGEVVEIRDGAVFIGGRPLSEPYIASLGRYSQPPTQIPEGQYFMLGDNRNNSSDSHYWGTLPREKILGKAWISYWPPRLWGVIPSETYAGVP
jgi:signal peptidase I